MKLYSRSNLFRLSALGAVTALAAAGAMPACAQNAPWMALVAPDNSYNFTFYKDLNAVANLGILGWGPNWAWKGISSNQRAQGGELNLSAPFEVDKAAGQVINLGLRAWKSGPQTVSFRYTLNADRDVPVTELAAVFAANDGFQDGDAVLTQANGKQTTIPLAPKGIQMVPDTSKVEFHSAKAGAYTLSIDPPTPIHVENGLRILLAQQQFPKGTRTVTLNFSFPGNVDFLASDADLAKFTRTLPGADWYPFNPSNDTSAGALGFQDWLDKPAGKHGGVRMVQDHFQFEDGTPVKFWGTNLAYGASAPNKDQADFMAARFAKWGVNAIRMHKFTGAGWAGIGDPNDATKMDPAGLDKLDYFASQLTKNGVYYGWSHTYEFQVRPANRDRLLSYDEIMKYFNGNTYGFINLAEDVQDLLIESVVNLLKHRNPYTGKTYAEDPALCYIELQNEDDIFFYTTDKAVNSSPVYKKHFQERFADWLKGKYGTTADLKKAWGDALKPDETLEARNIALQGNPWFMSEDHLPATTDGEKQRLLDNAAFLHYAQDQFYGKFVKAIRDAGYRGPLVGSPWQAPAMLPHLYNLLSDAQVGYIDRHDYFGGKLNDSMLANPGSGYLSAGLQQVVDRPFGLSEWIHVYPSLYSAEGPPLVAAYGMGLQGWDASYEFQSAGGSSAFSNIVGSFAYGVWNADVPTQIGQYPLLARMIARGDVPEGDVISVRRVSPTDLATGKFNFTDKVQQQGDIKTFGGSVPPAALAAGRCLIEFTDTEQASTFPVMAKYQQGKIIRANNSALIWDADGQGYFTLNSRGTKAVVGFAGGKFFALGRVSVKLDSPYASVLITAAEPKADLTSSRTALVSAMARSANTGFTYFVPDGRVIDNGKAPILMEPVRATITITGRPITAVNILDADGKRTGRTIPVQNGSFTIDGAADKTPYYEIVFG